MSETNMAEPWSSYYRWWAEKTYRDEHGLGGEHKIVTDVPGGGERLTRVQPRLNRKDLNAIAAIYNRLTGAAASVPSKPAPALLP